MFIFTADPCTVPTTSTLLKLHQIKLHVGAMMAFSNLNISNNPLSKLIDRTPFDILQTVLTLAGTGGGGLMQPPPLRFFWNIFFVNRSIVTIFSIAFRPSFLRPP